MGLCTLSGAVDNDFCTGSILVFDLSALQITSRPVPLKTYKVINTKSVIMQMAVMTLRNEGKSYLVVAKATRHLSSSASMVSLFDLPYFNEGKAIVIMNYISTLTVVNNAILVGDIYNGLTLLFYQVLLYEGFHVEWCAA